MSEQVTFKQTPMTLEGNLPTVGETAPDFTLADGDLKAVSLHDFRGRTVLLSTVPSLDTPVCDTETRRLAKELEPYRERVAFITVSMDLPFAQKRWCVAAELPHLITLSDYRDHEFGRRYGVRILDLGLLARAVFVIDSEGVVRYRELVPEVTHEPDYDAILQAVRAQLQ
jgi:thiol peroxidase